MGKHRGTESKEEMLARLTREANTAAANLSDRLKEVNDCLPARVEERLVEIVEHKAKQIEDDLTKRAMGICQRLFESDELNLDKLSTAYAIVSSKTSQVLFVDKGKVYTVDGIDIERLRSRFLQGPPVS